MKKKSNRTPQVVDLHSRARFCLMGPMNIWSEEGGYASPAVQIGPHDLTTTILDQVGKEHEDKPGSIQGIWKITVERIDNDRR